MPAIPLRVFIMPFAEQGVTESAKWSCDAASEALVVNAIWSKANMKFTILECVNDRPLDIAKSSRGDDVRVLNVLSLRQLGHLMGLDHVDIDYADDKQASLRSNLMTKGLSVGIDLTAPQIQKVKASKLVKRFAS